ncbi:MAG TPA: hypothetical protein VHL31_05145 [Geminicoccus sp.]|jgi:kynureninase|uniref:hypothetical protein n=1 Tax=Geminicoccus sp. TaxID=2024832 RepID=UPI002E360B52|nr:hypothetical protein [Geminicoccus sp.]HEX2525673.1 hypothetical protein [Geminicoccus sp.]
MMADNTDDSLNEVVHEWRDEEIRAVEARFRYLHLCEKMSGVDVGPFLKAREAQLAAIDEQAKKLAVVAARAADALQGALGNRPPDH